MTSSRGRHSRALLGAGAGLVAILAMSSCAPTPPPFVAPTPEVVATVKRLGSVPFQDGIARLAAIAVRQDATLVLPSGTYTATATSVLPPGLRLRLKRGAVITGSLPGQPLVRISARSTLSGGTLHNTATSPGFDLDFQQDAATVRITGVTFSGAGTNAVYLASSGIRDVTIERSRFVGVGYGILLNPGALDARGLQVRNNVFRQVCSDSIEINGATGGTAGRVRDVRITGNDIGPACGEGDSSGFGVGLAGVRGFTVARNTITGTRNEGVHLEDGTSNGRVTDNTITGGGTGSRPAIAIYRTTAGVLIDDNRIRDFAGSGIAVLWDSVGSASRITIRDNAVTRVKGDGVVVAGDLGTGPFVVDGNTIATTGGNGISVAGSHALSTITGNSLHGIGGTPIAEGLRGAGRTVIEGNGIGS